MHKSGMAWHSSCILHNNGSAWDAYEVYRGGVTYTTGDNDDDVRCDFKIHTDKKNKVVCVVSCI